MMTKSNNNKDYLFYERDIINITFDPSCRTEIQKRKPALIISNNKYNRNHKQVIVCPITSTNKKAFYLVPLKEPISNNILKAGSKVNTSQIYSFDITESGGRNPEKIGELNFREFFQILQFVMLSFSMPV